MIKINRGVFIDRQCKGVGVGNKKIDGNVIFLSRAPRSLSLARLALAHADVFQKSEKKSKSTSVYRLHFYFLDVLNSSVMFYRI